MKKVEMARALKIVRRAIVGLQALPSTREVQELDSALQAAVSFFLALRHKLSVVPSEAEVKHVSEALSTVCEFLERAQKDTTIGRAIGLLNPRPAPKKERAPSESKKEVDVAEFVRKLESLPTGEIQRELIAPRKYSTQLLGSIARHLGIHIDPHSPKHELVDKIVKIGFANPRAYSGLSRQSQ